LQGFNNNPLIFVMIKNSNLFSHTSSNHVVGRPFIILSRVESTNNYAMAKLHAGVVDSGTCFLAIHQTAGKGQRGKSWQARAGENITLSIALKLQNPQLRPFLLSAATALACYDLFNHYALDHVKIKWPNDIYWNDRKAGGILIESIFSGHTWLYAVIGIGININQTRFSPNAPNAVSLKQITGNTFDIVTLARELAERLDSRIQWMYDTDPEKIMEAYIDCLYKKGETVRLKQGNIIFETVIQRVEASGELISRDAMERRFSFGEIEWV